MARVYISIGSNIERQRYIQAALDALDSRFAPLTISSVYESESVGFRGDPFYNLVVGFDSQCSIAELFALLRRIEADNDRVRDGVRFAGRTLDLDLLLYDDVICQQPVELPRGEILYNAFVLWPLAQIAPQRRHPVDGRSFAILWQAYDKTSQALWPVSFPGTPSQDVDEPTLSASNNG